MEMVVNAKPSDITFKSRILFTVNYSYELNRTRWPPLMYRIKP